MTTLHLDSTITLYSDDAAYLKCMQSRRILFILLMHDLCNPNPLENIVSP